MAITTNKIATRTWSKDQYGDAALTYSTGNDCLVWDSLNQTSSTNNISPSSKTNGAIPNAKTPPSTQSYKCVTQGFIDSIYTPYTINVSKFLTKYEKFNGKHILIKAFYLNPGDSLMSIAAPGDSTTVAPTVAPILTNNGYINTNLNVEVTIIYKERSPEEGSNIQFLQEVARTTVNAVMTSSATAGLKEFIILNYTAGPTLASGTVTGTVNYSNFFDAYWEKMYSYYKSVSSNDLFVAYNFETIITVSPQYSLPLNSQKEVQKYLVHNEPVQTVENTTNSSIPSSTGTTSTYARIIYNCTSGPSIGPGEWTFVAYAYDLYPAYDSNTMEFIYVGNNVTGIYNSSLNRLEMTGSTSSSTTSVPKVTLRYGKKNATLSSQYVERVFAANMQEMQEINK